MRFVSLLGLFGLVVLSPIALLLGVGLSEATTVGMLQGEKLVLTEFVAYIHLGGIGGMAPGRMGDLAELGLRAMLGGSLATFTTACIAGALL